MGNLMRDLALLWASPADAACAAATGGARRGYAFCGDSRSPVAAARAASGVNTGYLAHCGRRRRGWRRSWTANKCVRSAATIPSKLGNESDRRDAAQPWANRSRTVLSIETRSHLGQSCTQNGRILPATCVCRRIDTHSTPLLNINYPVSFASSPRSQACLPG